MAIYRGAISRFCIFILFCGELTNILEMDTKDTKLHTNNLWITQQCMVLICNTKQLYKIIKCEVPYVHVYLLYVCKLAVTT